MLISISIVVCGAIGQGTSSHAADPVLSAFGLQASDPATKVNAEKELEQAYALRQKLTQRDLQAAIRLFVDSSRRFSLSGFRQKAALGELEAGDTYQMLSAYQLALAAYRRSFALSVGLPASQCVALAGMARTYANIGRHDDAKLRSDEAVALCQSIPDKRTFAKVLEARGEVEFWSKNPDDALPSFTDARKLASEAGDRDGEALSTMMLAVTIHGSDREQSNQLVQTALDLWTGTRNDYGAARTHLSMAFFAGDEGNFGAALCHCEKALPVFQRISDKDNAAVTLNVLGLVARKSGDMETAMDNYRQARKDFASAEDGLGEAESIIGMADVLVSQKEYGSALPLYARALYLAENTRNEGLVGSALMGTADVYLHTHQFGQAEANYKRSLAEYRASRNIYGEGIVFIRLADLRADQGRFREALEQLNKAQVLKEQAGEQEDLARIGFVRAQIFLKMNQIEEARSEIEKTIAIIESQRLRISKFDSRAQYFAFVHEYYSLYIQVLMSLDKLHPGQRYSQHALEVAERSKVRALLDMLENSQLTSSCDEVLAKNSDPHFTQVHQQTPGTPEVLSTQALTLAEIQAELGDSKTVLLEYALCKDRSFAWVVDGERISAFDLGPTAEISGSAFAFREALTPVKPRKDESFVEYLQRRQAVRSTLLLQSRQLARLLLEPLNLPAEKRVLIVPDGPLQYVPFAALSVSDTGGVTTPLIALHELTMLPSASVLTVLRRVAAKRPPPMDEVIVFADPVFSRSVPTASASIATAPTPERSHDLQRALKDSGGSQYIPSLPGSRIEALAIQQVVGPARTRLALGYDANRAAVIDGSLTHQRVIHFATHGFLDTRHPEMSGLILSLLNERGEYQDGYLRLSDIYNLKLSADLVVLSSCESALGKDLGSEGINGLPRGFLYAGARSVIASLWKVDDDATATLMAGLYSRMQQGENPSKALRGAQIDLLKDKRFSEPYYWAAFVLEGDYK
jgi:CHAT domain-containing protein/tetratricopeptide (TPR) repeat protein